MKVWLLACGTLKPGVGKLYEKQRFAFLNPLSQKVNLITGNVKFKSDMSFLSSPRSSGPAVYPSVSSQCRKQVGWGGVLADVLCSALHPCGVASLVTPQSHTAPGTRAKKPPGRQILTGLWVSLRLSSVLAECWQLLAPLLE